MQYTIILVELPLTKPPPQSLKGRCEHHSVYSPLKPLSITDILGRWSMKFDFKACENTTQPCLKLIHLLVTQYGPKLTENWRSKSLTFNIFYNTLISLNFFSNIMFNIIKTHVRPDRHQTAENGLGSAL